MGRKMQLLGIKLLSDLVLKIAISVSIATLSLCFKLTQQTKLHSHTKQLEKCTFVHLVFKSLDNLSVVTSGVVRLSCAQVPENPQESQTQGLPRPGTLVARIEYKSKNFRTKYD
jgi:hypothetical protein